MPAEPSLDTSGGSRPVPDPTLLTGSLVREATSALKETLQEKIEGQKHVFETRLDGMSEAVKLLQTIMDRFPDQVDVKIRHLEALHEEKFKGLDSRLVDRDQLRVEAKADAKVGIDAALASAEKLVGQSNDSFRDLFEKTAMSTEKLLDKQEKNQETTSRALDEKIAGLKERLDRIEGAAVGIVTQKADNQITTTNDRGSNQMNMQMISVAVAIIAIVVVLADKIFSR